MFYTYYDQIGNCIYHRYVDDDGKSHSEVVKEFPIELYTKGKKKPDSSRGLMGEVLNKIDFTSISDAKEFVYQYKDLEEIYGQTNFSYQFISHTYPEENIQFDFSKVKILILDIETAFSDEGFPTPEKANQEILAITCKVLGKDTKFICFGTKELKNALPRDVIYHQCRHENDLLSTFLKYFQEVNPDIITGWNTDRI